MTIRPPAPGTPLTDHQKHVLTLISQGHTNGHIATLLHIAENTVKTTVGRIYRALNVDNRVSAVLTGIDMHLIDQPPRPEPDTDPVLIALLRMAGDRWGHLGVAIAAARLTNTDTLVSRVTETRNQRAQREQAQPADHPLPCRCPAAHPCTDPVDPILMEGES